MLEPGSSGTTAPHLSFRCRLTTQLRAAPLSAATRPFRHHGVYRELTIRLSHRGRRPGSSHPGTRHHCDRGRHLADSVGGDVAARRHDDGVHLRLRGRLRLSLVRGLTSLERAFSVAPRATVMVSSRFRPRAMVELTGRLVGSRLLRLAQTQDASARLLVVSRRQRFSGTLLSAGPIPEA